jgi:hypothetical protein
MLLAADPKFDPQRPQQREGNIEEGERDVLG